MGAFGGAAVAAPVGLVKWRRRAGKPRPYVKRMNRPILGLQAPFCGFTNGIIDGDGFVDSSDFFSVCSGIRDIEHGD